MNHSGGHGGGHGNSHGKKKGSKTLDDLLDELAHDSPESIEKGFEKYDEISKEEKQNELFNRLFVPAQKALYDVGVEALDHAFGDDATKVHKEEDSKKMKEALAKGLRAYFEKVQPSRLAGTEGLSGEDLYEHLVGQYDAHIGAGQSDKVTSLKAVVDGLIRKKKTVGDLKKHLYALGAEHAQGAVGNYISRFVNHYLAPHHHRLHAHVMKELEESGMQVKDEKKLDFLRAGIDELLDMRKTYVSKKRHEYLEKASGHGEHGHSGGHDHGDHGGGHGGDGHH